MVPAAASTESRSDPIGHTDQCWALGCLRKSLRVSTTGDTGRKNCYQGQKRSNIKALASILHLTLNFLQITLSRKVRCFGWKLKLKCNCPTRGVIMAPGLGTRSWICFLPSAPAVLSPASTRDQTATFPENGPAISNVRNVSSLQKNLNAGSSLYGIFTH